MQCQRYDRSKRDPENWKLIQNFEELSDKDNPMPSLSDKCDPKTFSDVKETLEFLTSSRQKSFQIFPINSFNGCI